MKQLKILLSAAVIVFAGFVRADATVGDGAAVDGTIVLGPQTYGESGDPLKYRFAAATAETFGEIEHFTTFSFSVDTGNFTFPALPSGDFRLHATDAAGAFLTGEQVVAGSEYRSFVLSGNISAAAVQSFLRSMVLTLENVNVLQHVQAVADVFELPEGTVRFGTSYYQYVDGWSTWYDAYEIAKNQTFNGLTGYLLTIESQTEHDFIYQYFNKNAWFGAIRSVDATYPSADAATYGDQTKPDDNIGDWYWVCGPSAGVKFYIGQDKRPNGFMVDGVYCNWSVDEPDGYSHSEWCGQYGFGEGGGWNDLKYNYKSSSNGTTGCYVEFTEYPGGGTMTVPFVKDEVVSSVVDYVARIGETLYRTLPLACAAAEDGDEIYLLKDCPLMSNVNTKPISFTINGDGHTVTRTAATHFSVFSDTTLALTNIVFNGNSDNVTAQTGLVGNAFEIISGGELIVGENAVICNYAFSGEPYASRNAGGTIQNRGSLVIDGGTISNNYVTCEKCPKNWYVGGAGVLNETTGTFTFKSGLIANNDVHSTAKSQYNPSGAGVLNLGTFTLSGGEIIGNCTSCNTDSTKQSIVYGGGVMNGGTMYMTAGKVAGNLTYGDNYARSGAGIALGSWNSTAGILYMTGGEVTANTNGVNRAGDLFGGGIVGGIGVGNGCQLHLGGDARVTDNVTVTAVSPTLVAETCNVYIESQSRVWLDEDFTGVVGIKPSNQSWAAPGQQFGVMDGLNAGAENFVCDTNDELRGSVNGSTLVWTDQVCYTGGGRAGNPWTLTEIGTEADVIVAGAVARIGENYYATFDEAWNDSVADDTIYLIADCTMSEKHSPNGNRVIDGQNHTLAFTAQVSNGPFWDFQSGDYQVEFKDVDIEGSQFSVKYNGTSGPQASCFSVNGNGEKILFSGSTKIRDFNMSNSSKASLIRVQNKARVEIGDDVCIVSNIARNAIFEVGQGAKMYMTDGELAYNQATSIIQIGGSSSPECHISGGSVVSNIVTDVNGGGVAARGSGENGKVYFSGDVLVADNFYNGDIPHNLYIKDYKLLNLEGNFTGQVGVSQSSAAYEGQQFGVNAGAYFGAINFICDSNAKLIGSTQSGILVWSPTEIEYIADSWRAQDVEADSAELARARVLPEIPDPEEFAAKGVSTNDYRMLFKKVLLQDKGNGIYNVSVQLKDDVAAVVNEYTNAKVNNEIYNAMQETRTKGKLVKVYLTGGTPGLYYSVQATDDIGKTTDADWLKGEWHRDLCDRNGDFMVVVPYMSGDKAFYRLKAFVTRYDYEFAD